MNIYYENICISISHIYYRNVIISIQALRDAGRVGLPRARGRRAPGMILVCLLLLLLLLLLLFLVVVVVVVVLLLLLRLLRLSGRPAVPRRRAHEAAPPLRRGPAERIYIYIYVYIYIYIDNTNDDNTT